MADLETRMLGPEAWAVWRSIRLRALAQAPDAFGSTLAHESTFDEADWRVGLTDDGPRVVVLADQEPIAMGGAYLAAPDRLHVIAMWTDPVWRGRRIAVRVLTALVEWADARGMAVQLDVATENQAARRTYQTFGFTATGETRPLRDGSPALVERMVLRRG